jgi:hypothetical protein
MPFSKVKDLVKNLAEKLESSNQNIDELSTENKELKSRMRELIGEQKLPEFKQKKKNSKERDPNKEYKEPKKDGPGRGKRGKKNYKIKISRKKKWRLISLSFLMMQFQKDLEK